MTNDEIKSDFVPFLFIMLTCKGMSSETIRNVYNFCSGAVGVYQIHVQPRSLKHLYRPTVRRMLWERDCWMTDGIRLTGLPRELQSFLNPEA
ncbi:hypothetical protein AVEN_272720-1 [Araneus ventricosus]|uniref:SOCS box domain-containing protein n=1 Tax=Araneus ventricosus TaxID=182803 RepID=A0A4Y2RIQ1_ARAVE|nr:hypothetical protein AVEN_272720-1 [Araneus ventricosus]